MITKFSKLNDKSRIWIFGSDKKLTDSQIKYINSSITCHIQDLSSHKNPLLGSFCILEKYFIIIAIDESINVASGCSVDTIIRLIQSIQNHLSMSLLNRQNIFCRINSQIVCVPLSKIKEIANSDTLFYDLTIKNKGQIKDILRPIREGWCANLV